MHVDYVMVGKKAVQLRGRRDELKKNLHYKVHVDYVMVGKKAVQLRGRRDEL